MKSFREDVERAVAYHGHLCSGQCIGVKMAHLGMKTIGVDPEVNPKSIYVFVECDRCPADAIGIATGTRVGKRTFRAMDYGKIAATFVNLDTNEAVRIQRHTRRHPADGEDLISFYENLPDEEMFKIQRVEVDLKPSDLPGVPSEIGHCEVCGEDVTPTRHVVKDGKILCKSCAGMSYYKLF